ncbi:MAG: cytochrome b/b6 domain-containing protein [Gammaproteobacteria bacterium]
MPARHTDGTVAYGTAARIFHWAVAALLLLQVPLAFYMVDQPLGPDKLGNYATHKAIGLLIFAVTALRLAWRVTHPSPLLPANVPGWQRLGARATQLLLYALMFLMPVTGLLRSQAANFPVSFFGWFTVPTLVGVNKQFSEGMHEAHEMQGTILLVLVAAHGLAALYHHFVRKDDVLRTMLPVVLAGLILLASVPVSAADYTLVPAGSRLGFTAIQQGAKFESRFGKFTTEMRFDPARPASGRITARIALASVDTGNAERDGVLQSGDWYSTSQWPEAVFTAGRIVRDGTGYRAEGTLSLRNASRPVTLRFRWTPANGDEPARLTGSAALERLAFGVGQGDWQDTTYVGNAVEVQVDVRLREVPATDKSVSIRTKAPNANK